MTNQTETDILFDKKEVHVSVQKLLTELEQDCVKAEADGGIDNLPLAAQHFVRWMKTAYDNMDEKGQQEMWAFLEMCDGAHKDFDFRSEGQKQLDANK